MKSVRDGTIGGTPPPIPPEDYHVPRRPHCGPSQVGLSHGW
jgi:hypothetical protein